MCWSGEASTVLAVMGFATAGYVAYKKEAKPLWIALAYFSLMEALQAYTYSVINECGAPQNQIATLLGYMHISLQPLFINLISLYFVPKAVREKIWVWVYGVCLLSTVIMVIQLFPFPWAGHCDPRRPLCADALCSVSGNWHIAWNVPTNGIGNYFTELGWPALRNGFPAYVFAGLLMPLLYGSWRLTLFHFILGPAFARLTTNNLNEWPAIWCLLSIGILMVVVKTPLRDHLHVKSWFWWPKAWTEKPKPAKGAPKAKTKRKKR